MRLPHFARSPFSRLFNLTLSSRSPRALPKTRTPFLTQQLRSFRTMDAQELAQYFADSPPAVVRLEIEKHFDALTDKQKRYAHFISRYVPSMLQGAPRHTVTAAVALATPLFPPPNKSRSFPD